MNIGIDLANGPDRTVVVVRIPERMIARLDHDVHLGVHALNALREAGVPVIGRLSPQSVEYGRLTIEDDLDGSRVYTWEK